MKRKVTYDAYATTKSGERVFVQGEAEFDDTWISPSRKTDVAMSSLQRQGFRNPHIVDAKVADD
ncbi:hypothetical protein [Streptomyces sp. NPDC086519]|uniref:hypothetical protein n=1 Tax=Streptomyces sp. NPDC086519 TaxID=3154863 RepID=UPI003422EBF0